MVNRGAGPVTQFVEAFLSQVRLNEVLAVHAVFCGVVGTLLVLSPHGFVGRLSGVYSHFAHEIIRCYGALTLAQAWMTFQSRNITDHRVRKFLCESYAMCYGLHFFALLRAQTTGHSGLLGLFCTFMSLVLSLLYAYFRFMNKRSKFQLPKAMGADL